MKVTKHHFKWAHPLVREWFLDKFKIPTEPQTQGWPFILSGETTLISAPTGSGKTLAAFLVSINDIITQAANGSLQDHTQVLYVSPLKALSNDIQKNLLQPLTEITALAKKQGILLSEIRVAVRTGDTLMKERQAMLKKPPHILVTTPESFYILLTAQKSRALLTTIKTVIIDEIHAMVNDKRGSHLALSIERLHALTTQSFTRIGLSATQKPLETVAQFLAGQTQAKYNIVNIGHERQLELIVEVPGSELTAVASNEMWDEIYDRLALLAQQNRSTLVFVNTRKLSERIAHHLAERLGEACVASHHGSLSRKLRLDAETRLKNGELKVLVATASLELGIDIGTIDMVCQIGSPRAIAAALQRVGRAGHWHGAISKGRFFATTRDELVECAALIYAIRQGDLDELIIPEEPLDILAQQIIASCATQDWKVTHLYQTMKKAFPYHHLKKKTFDEIIKMLSEGIAGSRGRYGTYLLYDKVNGIVKARRNCRLTAITSGGAIPDTGLFTVIAEPSGTVIGTLDEDFAVESNRGDIILLGSTSWRVKRIETASGRVLVEDAHGASPSVPFWRGEAPERSKELSLQLSNLRQIISDKLKNKIAALSWVKINCGLDQSGAEQLINYIENTKAILGAIPTQNTIIAERFFDETGGMQLVIHAPFGARINKAWGLALRKRFCRTFNFELQAAATDNGLNIALAEQHSFPLSDVFHYLHPNTITEVLVQAVLQSPLFKIRWRWVAMRSLAIVRSRNGKKTPPNILRVLAEDLLAAVFPDAAACQDNLAGKDIDLPHHPLIDETMKDALHEALNIEGLITLLEKIYQQKITCLSIDTPVPSPFSHEILNANPYAFLDDAPLEERRARAVEMRRFLPENLLQDIGKLNPHAINEVKEQAWPDVRNADELHDTLQTLIAFPAKKAATNWSTFYEELNTQGRAVCVKQKEQDFWFAIEKARSFHAIYPNIPLNFSLEYEETTKNKEDAIVDMIRGWMLHVGPVSASQLSNWVCIDKNDVETALLKLETSGLILRGNFIQTSEEVEWCERRLLARIHRLTIQDLRKSIESVTSAQFMRWLLKWQHLESGTQLHGERGLLEIIRQLQGFEIPARDWEKHIFAKRIANYQSSMLDNLCLNGMIGWGRLSMHPSLLAEDNEKSIIPKSTAPITFFIRENSDWILALKQIDPTTQINGLSNNAKLVLEALKQKGALFLSDIVRATNRLQTQVELALWELVAAGIITADSFDNLRALIDSKRRKAKYRHRDYLGYSKGRWNILHIESLEKNPLESLCWVLLNRYGVVFRDLLAREKNMPRWRELLLIFRNLEHRGEIRAGRFVSGFLGEQFALPEAIDSLRAIKKQEPNGEKVTIAAVDPLNLLGIILPGEKVSAVSKISFTLEDGVFQSQKSL
ncbi:MAG: DEAD/DEAH box helicase [Proteobacteria bacterium]|nr:DEAD/DEAH box helicase [Pseudomonadota bacterium]